ncbi:MAG: UDP-N-acetylmuramate:L-alanyl-gamma-D-glutamyl-meso-diaminopimelate ligase [Lautropia sp.]|nr:UDP-N-acetylmuramate:L-alanyl-gamma-D-glutamyl-meso-diaminopimelate ligase [Lautropia sp.]
MHIHILGICGTFMGGVAAIAKEAGFRVTGCDANVYPPMSDQLRALGIELIEGWGTDQLALKPDVWVIGNVVRRGNPLMEAILNAGLRYMSGPQWLAEQVLAGRWVMGVAGTHGKTTTASLLAWILEANGREPGFLIGGVPGNFPVSARLGRGRHFVIEADEYDTAFFDKRSKFVHYGLRTAVLNNLEYDHADIFPDLAAIETQFHHLVRTVPGEGRLIWPADATALQRVLARGCWSAEARLGADGWHAAEVQEEAEATVFVLKRGETVLGTCRLPLAGAHNRANAIAAIAAAEHIGINPADAIEALARFKGVRRRLEVRGTVRGVTVIDDFAHHPTAIETTIEGLRARMLAQGQRAAPVGATLATDEQDASAMANEQGAAGSRRVAEAGDRDADQAGRDTATMNGRLLAVLEPRSNTMRAGAMKDRLAESLSGADRVYCYSGGIDWDAAEALAPLGAKLKVLTDMDALEAAILADARAGDAVLVMSNGGFGGIHARLLAGLARAPAERA